MHDWSELTRYWCLLMDIIILNCLRTRGVLRAVILILFPSFDSAVSRCSFTRMTSSLIVAVAATFSLLQGGTCNNPLIDVVSADQVYSYRRASLPNTTMSEHLL